MAGWSFAYDAFLFHESVTFGIFTLKNGNQAGVNND